MNKFMAFRMSGFQQLCVVEEIAPAALTVWPGLSDWVVVRPNPGGFYLFRSECDGEIFDTREEAQAMCDRANVGNPFARPGSRVSS